jgi:hypothetical protein
VISGGLPETSCRIADSVRGEARSYSHGKGVGTRKRAREAFERAAARVGATVEYTERCAGQAF